jgi:hypothetical protein
MSGEPAGELSIRLSDEERGLAAKRLDDAVVAGKITWTEHADRTAKVWAARTQGELAPCLADLGPVPEHLPAQRVDAVFSKIVRTPESSREVVAHAKFGAVVLDLSAMRAGEQIRVEASSFCGKVMIRVAEDATVVDEGAAVLGKRKILGAASAPGGPVVRISGTSTLGHLKVYRGDRWW